MKVQGKLIKKDSVKTFGDNGFRKRDIVILTDEQYPQSILIELHQDNVDLVKDLSKDENIEVSINLRGRKWVNPQGEEKFFNSLVGWRVEKIQAHSSHPAPDPLTEGNTQDDEDDLNNLPF